MSKAAEKAKRLGFAGVNKPKLTRGHATKKAAVVSTLGPGQEDGVLVRFGDQKMGNNYSPKARAAFRKRHAKNIARKGSAAYWANRFLWKAGGHKKSPPKSQKKKYN